MPLGLARAADSLTAVATSLVPIGDNGAVVGLQVPAAFAGPFRARYRQSPSA